MSRLAARRAAVMALVVVTVVGGSNVAAAQEAQGDTAAVAINKRDGSSVFRLAFSVKRVMTSDVDADNSAVAYASCTDCQTVASSIQVVLVMSDAETVTTDNVAIAINYQCSGCETLAAAFQYVFGNGEPVRFSAEGNRQLADIRRRYQALRQRDDLTLEELAQAMALLAAEVAKVVETELVKTGREGTPAAQAPAETTTTTTTPTTTETTGVTTTTSGG
jgi:putative peptide zinc metalloprotease protein